MRVLTKSKLSTVIYSRDTKTWSKGEVIDQLLSASPVFQSLPVEHCMLHVLFVLEIGPTLLAYVSDAYCDWDTNAVEILKSSLSVCGKPISTRVMFLLIFDLVSQNKGVVF